MHLRHQGEMSTWIYLWGSERKTGVQVRTVLLLFPLFLLLLVLPSCVRYTFCSCPIVQGYSVFKAALVRNHVIEHPLYAKHSSHQLRYMNTFNPHNHPRVEDQLRSQCTNKEIKYRDLHNLLKFTLLVRIQPDFESRHPFPENASLPVSSCQN